MGYLNIPANGWPQLKDLEKLDKIAQQMENMPTFTSDDRAFLEALPTMPTEEGKRVLTATTDNQGDTELTYETQEVESADIAPTFSETVTYSAGTLVYYDGVLYKFTEDHAAGAWEPSEVTPTSAAAEFVEANAAIDELKNTLIHKSTHMIRLTNPDLSKGDSFTLTDNILNNDGYLLINGVFPNAGSEFCIIPKDVVRLLDMNMHKTLMNNYKSSSEYYASLDVIITASAITFNRFEKGNSVGSCVIRVYDITDALT